MSLETRTAIAAARAARDAAIADADADAAAIADARAARDAAIADADAAIDAAIAAQSAGILRSFKAIAAELGIPLPDNAAANAAAAAN